MDISPHVHGAKRLWATRPWGEMSSAGAKCVWGKLSLAWKVLTPRLTQVVMEKRPLKSVFLPFLFALLMP